MTFKNARTLADLSTGESALVLRLDVPDTFGERLIQLGFAPGEPVEAGRAAPGGDPRVYRVDGADIALRRETALQIFIR